MRTLPSVTAILFSTAMHGAALLWARGSAVYSRIDLEVLQILSVDYGSDISNIIARKHRDS